MAINVENVRRVRDHIATLNPKQFNMSAWRWPQQECGTAACIGGWAEAVLFPDDPDDVGSTDLRDALGIREEQWVPLFAPPGWSLRVASPYSQAAAVAVLDHLIETGEVDWDYAIAKVAADSPASHVAESEG